MGNLVEQSSGNVGLRVLCVSGDDGVEGEDIGSRGGVEGKPGCGEAAAFGVEEDEVV